jgi:hypothetical protein
VSRVSSAAAVPRCPGSRSSRLPGPRTGQLSFAASRSADISAHDSACYINGCVFGGTLLALGIMLYITGFPFSQGDYPLLVPMACASGGRDDLASVVLGRDGSPGSERVPASVIRSYSHAAKRLSPEGRDAWLLIRAVPSERPLVVASRRAVRSADERKRPGQAGGVP